MSDIEILKRSIKVCMFDQYGTVVDMQTGLWEVAVDFLKTKGWKGNAYAFVTWWRRTHFENSMIDALLQRAHLSYRAIGHLSVGQVLTRARIAHTAEDVEYLVSCIERLKCFPEVPDALARLQARYKLVVLSNGDPDMLEAARKHHGIPFDAVISVAEANAFKPHRATYEMAAERTGVALDEVMFVANHEFDCVGAKAAGMRTAFIDRRQRPFAAWPYQPDLVLPSMTALADVLV
ncbi:haloacid dehalogenase type II [Rhodopila sp.]|uniref:haloacid dehalogenase type II n=1 Tax=Rhodopila sp. TaxID=2480087 RepID=UPI003D138165